MANKLNEMGFLLSSYHMHSQIQHMLQLRLLLVSGKMVCSFRMLSVYAEATGTKTQYLIRLMEVSNRQLRELSRIHIRHPLFSRKQVIGM